MTKPKPITIILFSVAAASLLAFTVAEHLNKPEDFGPKVSLSKNNINPVSLPSFSTKKNPAHGQPGHQCGIPVGAPLPSGTKTTTASPAFASLSLPQSNNQSELVNLAKSTEIGTALDEAKSVAINPAHGKPGHRCDIAVGAPLNSAPAIASTANTSTVPKNNPAHGQPYHRCDLAVGAPLSSAPAKATATSSPASKPPQNNPAHGQPYHRCDIAVGAPLNSKPAKSTAPSVPVYTPFIKTDSSAAPLPTNDSTGAK